MRVTFPIGTRSFPTDRNPTPITIGTGQQMVGGFNAQIVNYTCPALRRAILSADLGAVVTTALAAGQTGVVQLQQTGMVGGAPTSFFQSAAAIGVREVQAQQDIYVSAGQQVIILGVLGAGVGVLQATAGLHGVEYDA